MRLLLIAAFVAALGPSAALGVDNSPTFRTRRDYFTAGCSQLSGPGVAVADTNSDGIPDLICGGVNLIVFPGNGDGTFQTSGITSTIAYGSGSPTPLDLNGDGHVDLVITAGVEIGGPVGLGVSFGNGDGTFQSAAFYQTGSDRYCTWIVIGDFNGDSIPDVATLGESGIWLLFGKGGGFFNPAVLLTVPQSQPFFGLASADLNGDGKLDLIAAAGKGFSVSLGNGNGSFLPPVSYSWPGLPAVEGFAVGDLNGDGRLDLVASQGSYFRMYPGNGDGGFGAPVTLNFPYGSKVAIADLNGDGKPDLVNSNGYIVYGKGGGAFTKPLFYPIASGPNGAYVLPADLRHSGRLDLVFVNFYTSLSVLLNQGSGAYSDGKFVPIDSGGAYCSVSADFNRDGHPDLAVATLSGFSILLGTGHAASPFTRGPVVAVPNPGCPLLADINRDGIPDLVVASGPYHGAGSVLTFFGVGDGTFTPGPSSPLPNVGILVLGDFNGDGKIDYASQTNLLGLGNGDGSFQTPYPFVPNVDPGTQLNGFSSIAAGNLNGDRATDLVLTDNIDELVYVLISAGPGGFRQTNLYTSQQCYFPTIAAIGDANGDGYNDLLLGCYESRVPIYLNNGAGKLTYSASVSYELVDDGARPLVADINGDGIPDILVSSNYDVAVFAGQGSLNFAAPLYFGHGPAPAGLLTANLHGQPPHAARPDLVVSDASGAIDILFNTTP